MSCCNRNSMEKITSASFFAKHFLFCAWNFFISICSLWGVANIWLWSWNHLDLKMKVWVNSLNMVREQSTLNNIVSRSTWGHSLERGEATSEISLVCQGWPNIFQRKKTLLQHPYWKNGCCQFDVWFWWDKMQVWPFTAIHKN